MKCIYCGGYVERGEMCDCTDSPRISMVYRCSQTGAEYTITFPRACCPVAYGAIGNKSYRDDEYLGTSAEVLIVEFRAGARDFRFTNLVGADLKGADLTGADLTGADLKGADLDGADLTGADLTGADLKGARLTGADLTGADLTSAKLKNACVWGQCPKALEASGADLSAVRWRPDGGTREEEAEAEEAMRRLLRL